MKKLLIAVASIVLAVPLLASDYVIYPTSIVPQVLSNPFCPGNSAWHALYNIPVGQGFGWAPDTNNATSFSASITNRTDVYVTANSQAGDFYCNFLSVGIPNPPPGPKYRFTVYGNINMPTATNQLPLLLHNFKP